MRKTWIVLLVVGMLALWATPASAHGGGYQKIVNKYLNVASPSIGHLSAGAEYRICDSSGTCYGHQYILVGLTFYKGNGTAVQTFSNTCYDPIYAVCWHVSVSGSIACNPGANYYVIASGQVLDSGHSPLVATWKSAKKTCR